MSSVPSQPRYSQLDPAAAERRCLLPPPTESGAAPEVAYTSDTEMALNQWLKQISVPVYLLVIVFALASWIDINGLWVELPLMVNVLPEGWNLPSYLVVIIQIANIGPLTYTIVHRCCPNRVKEWPVVYLIITIGGVACILLALSWQRTTYIFGDERSAALLVLSGFLAIVDCTSSVVFLPYMALFKPQYMTALYIGEGLSGFIPGIAGLIQGVGSEECRNVTETIYNETTGQNTTYIDYRPVPIPPRFSVEAFFYFLFFILVCSGVAFTFLNFLPYCQNEMVMCIKRSKNDLSAEYEISNGGQESAEVELKTNNTTPASESDGPFDSHYRIIADEIVIEDEKGLNAAQTALLLGIIAWVNCIANGVIPSTQSYSSLPYSNMVYTLTIRLSSIVNPLACFMSLFVQTRSLPGVMLLTSLGSCASAYQLYLASMSPHPPLVGTLTGDVLAVLSAIVMTALFSYVKVTVASILRDEGRQALIWCGALTQFGSFVGAIVTFVLVNVYNLFEAADHSNPCVL